MTYKTIKLDPDTWDLTLDGSGNIAIADESYSVAQDVASACLVFQGECWFDNTLGIPWKEQALGVKPSAGFFAQKMQGEAKKLSVVSQALASIFFDRATRTTRGAIRITDIFGNTSEVRL